MKLRRSPHLIKKSPLTDTTYMKPFTLDPKLQQDCFVLGKLGSNQLLLMNNSLVPWFILVPEVDRSVTELYQLELETQQSLLEEIDKLSKFVAKQGETEKLNVAAIGNVVSQLHIHVVGRNKNDFCWPNVIWGTEQKQPYTDDAVQELSERLKSELQLQPVK